MLVLGQELLCPRPGDYSLFAPVPEWPITCLENITSGIVAWSEILLHEELLFQVRQCGARREDRSVVATLLIRFHVVR